MDINKKKENILKLSEEERYDYFTRRLTDFEEVWGLDKDGWALLRNDLNNQVFPFWPEKEFAKLCAVDQWEGYVSKSIDIYTFLEKWIPGMELDKILVSIFYTPQAKGKVISPQILGNALNEELEQYE